MNFSSLFRIFSEKLKKDRDLKELVHGSAIYFVIKLLGILINYLFTLFVTRYYGASIWGLFTLSLSILQIISVIGRFGLDTALLRFIAEYRSQGKYFLIKLVYKKVALFIFLLSLLLAVGLYILAPIISKNFLNKEDLTVFIEIVALILPVLTLLYLNTESLRAFKRIGLYAISQNLLPFLIALIALAILTRMFNKSIYLVPVSYLIGVYISSFLSFIFLLRTFKEKGIESSFQYFQKKISFISLLFISFPMLIANSLTLIMSWIDIIFLGIFQSEFSVGIYSVANKLSLLISFPLAAINSIAAPKFAESWGKKDLKNLKQIAQEATKMSIDHCDYSVPQYFIEYNINNTFFVGIIDPCYKASSFEQQSPKIHSMTW